MKEIKKKLLKGWGKKCKAFSPLCGVCLAWQAFETLDGLHSIKSHITNWKKVKK